MIVNIIEGMDKEIITPRVFEAKEADYKEALRLRREEILRLAENNVTQQKIAERWNLDISRINRIINQETAH